MKIVHVNAVYGEGSTGIIVEDIHNLCLKNGIESLVAYSTSKQKECEITGAIKIGGFFDKKLHAVFSRIFGKQAYFSNIATQKFLKRLDKRQPDIVTLHNLHSNYLNLNKLLKYLAKRDIATVITLHDCWFFTGKCFHYIDVGCEKFQTGCGKCPKKKHPPKSFIFDTSKKVFQDKEKNLSKIPQLTVVGCSDWICNEAKKSFLKHRKILRIYNGVDTNIFKPQDRDGLKKKLNIESKRVIMGMANKWLLPENKKAFESIYNSLDDETEIVLVGCADNQKEELKDYTKIHKIGKKKH